MLRHLITCTVATGVFAVVGAVTTAGNDGRAAGSKDALTAASMPELHRLIRPQADEYRWDQVDWYASIWHARQAAAEQDKPILVFGTGGAGFNDPLGNC